jgi:hypothetical protein
MARRSLNILQNGTGCSPAAFRSSVTVSARTNSAPESKFPACCFASSPDASAARSALLLHGQFRFAPVPAPSTLSGPLQRLRPASSAAPSSFGSPSGDFAPPGSKSSTGFAADRPAFRTRPISCYSPPPVLFLVWAADHRSKSATFPEARCSSNLLEPSSLCGRTPFPSTEFVSWISLFLNIYLVMFPINYRQDTVN